MWTATDETDDQTCSRRANCCRNEQPSADAYGNDDENHFNPFEHDSLERRHPGNPVEVPVAPPLRFEEACRFRGERNVLVMKS